MLPFEDEEFTPEIDSVDEYFFEDTDGLVISFSIVPVLFDDTCKPNDDSEKFVLRGVIDGGLQPVYQGIVAWKLASGYDRAKIKVLTKECKWITLLKPRKSYLLEERSMMITVEMLHFLMKKPHSSQASLWDHLHKIFSKLTVPPSKEDIKDHALIKLFMQKNKNLGTSLVILDLVGEESRNSFSEGVPKDMIIAPDDEADEGNKTSNNEDNSESGNLHESDSFCAICDDGGDLLCCEGGCFRSFHATKTAGEPSNCKSLGLTEEDLKATTKFICQNCLYEQHQCFACGKLGSSNKEKGAEVYVCGSAACGHFYHPKCIAKLIFRDSEAEVIEYERKIERGIPFTCTLHYCDQCKKIENKKVEGFQLAICRRCPKAYHKKCIPRKIILEDKSTTKRIWDDNKFDRIVLYCLKHKIDQEIGTPARNHIIFPDDLQKKKVASMQKKKKESETKKKRKNTNREVIRNPKKICKETFKIPDKEKTDGMQNKKIKTKVKNKRVGFLCPDGTIAKPVEKGFENDCFGNEVPASKKQKDRTSEHPLPAIKSKTGKRCALPFHKFSKTLSMVRSKTVRHARKIKSRATNGRQIDKTVAQAKDINSEKRDDMIISQELQLGSADSAKETPSLLPSFFASLGQLTRPWSCAEASRNCLHPVRGFVLRSDESARSQLTSCGWLED